MALYFHLSRLRHSRNSNANLGQVRPRETANPPRAQPSISPVSIPMLNISNLPDLQSEAELGRYPLAPRFAPGREYSHNSYPEPFHDDFLLNMMPLPTHRKQNDTINVKDLMSDYTISPSDEISELCCTICLCNFEKGEKAAKLECGHIFHQNCITLWLKKIGSKPTCPTCRHLLKKQ